MERGHVYIAQPPLYKVKHGKDERYLKDDHELKEYLLRIALRDAELIPAAGSSPLAAEALEQVARSYILAEAVIDRVERGSCRRVCQTTCRSVRFREPDYRTAI